MAKWIWLDPNVYPEYSATSEALCYAELVNTYTINSKEHITIKISADARYMLYINGEFIGRGPSSAGSDYIQGKMSHYYLDEYELIARERLEIRAIVSSKPTVMCEYSFKQSGFYFELVDSQGRELSADGEWKCRVLSERVSDTLTDYTKEEHKYSTPVEIPDIYNLKKSPIKHLCEREISPIKSDKIDLKTPTGCVIFDKIYSAYPKISIKADGLVKVKMEFFEIDGVGIFREQIITNRDVVHTSPRMRSTGGIKITLEPISAKRACIEDAKIIYSAYPVENETGFKCSDTLLNRIFDVCIHTLKICRRDLHLDSPTHQEPLACTGDYYIQSLMEYLNMYDPSLSAFDIFRTAKILEAQDGKMFHTTYSLIFAQWLYDYYMYTADKELPLECLEAIRKLLSRFDTYIGENGLIERAPDYMFVDWILMDENGNHTDPTNMMSHGGFEGYSLHHPPKALGQSVLCMFYYNALCRCADIFDTLNCQNEGEECRKKAQKIKNAINTHLYDSERELYKGGLNTPNEAPSSQWLGDNTDKVFYLKQANTLAVLYGIAPENKRKAILEYVVTGLKKEEMQPYFYHFLLEALYKENMFEKYGLSLIRRYESLLEKCDKGLLEAWEMFPCDCSHAWGGAPAYMLKKALSGFEMLEAGYKKVKLSPKLYDLDSADFAISTPYGAIEVKLLRDEKTITSPSEIEIIMEN